MRANAILRAVRTASLPRLFLRACIGLAAFPAAAASLALEVKDARGAPVEDAVAWVVPKGAAAPRPKRDAEIAQVDKEFVPLVSVVQVGTLVAFPNRDTIRHHVYSFSPTKRFEIKLYVGTPAAPELFDKPGVVVLGCNIHDHMIAYLAVVDSPWYGKSGKDGRIRIEGLPAGEFELHAWHYAQSARIEARSVRLRGDEAAELGFALPLKPAAPRPPPK